MKNLNDLKVINSDYDLDVGFFWITFENSKSLQCCLQYRKDEKRYKKSIKADDSGLDVGLSGENNLWALTEYNADNYQIKKLLYKHARKSNIKIV